MTHVLLSSQALDSTPVHPLSRLSPPLPSRPSTRSPRTLSTTLVPLAASESLKVNSPMRRSANALLLPLIVQILRPQSPRQTLLQQHLQRRFHSPPTMQGPSSVNNWLVALLVATLVSLALDCPELEHWQPSPLPLLPAQPPLPLPAAPSP